MRIDLGYVPRKWQLLVHQIKKRFTVIVVHRRGGKSEVGVMELIESAMNFDLELGLFFYIAPFLKQAKAIAWARLKQRLMPVYEAGGCDFNETELSVTFRHNGAVIRVFGADNPDAMRGVRLDGCVIDEVAQIKPAVWGEIIQPALADRLGWCIFIGTPQGVNLFSELYYKGKSGAEDWVSALFTVYDTNALPAREIERLKRDMSPTSFSREFLCDFTAAGDDQLISLYDVELAAQKVYAVRDFDYAPKILGVDPARFGDNKTVIMPRQGKQVFTPGVNQGINNMTAADKVMAKIDNWEADACFIDVGMGQGIIDRCLQLNYDVVEVNFGGSPIDKQYVNKRTEIWWLMKNWIEAGGALPRGKDMDEHIMQLKQDLAAPHYWINPNTNKKHLESKDDIIKRGLSSPDYGDALALTFAAPVAKKVQYSIPGVHGRNKREYDPYQNM